MPLSAGMAQEQQVDAPQIADNLQRVRDRIAKAAVSAGRDPAEITLVAVCKTFGTGHIRAAFLAGVRHFGENRVQEAADKIPHLADLTPRPTWHMIGHLQHNKAKAALELFDVIHSVDSLRLAQSLAGRAAPRTLPVLLEVNVAGEASKFGFGLQEVEDAALAIGAVPSIELRGLMTVAPLTSDREEARPVFRKLRALRDRLGLRDLSMGMTDDFEVAIQEGATIVRIGRAIFGDRT